MLGFKINKYNYTFEIKREFFRALNKHFSHNIKAINIKEKWIISLKLQQFSYISYPILQFIFMLQYICLYYLIT